MRGGRLLVLRVLGGGGGLGAEVANVVLALLLVEERRLRVAGRGVRGAPRVLRRRLLHGHVRRRHGPQQRPLRLAVTVRLLDRDLGARRDGEARLARPVRGPPARVPGPNQAPVDARLGVQLAPNRVPHLLLRYGREIADRVVCNREGRKEGRNEHRRACAVDCALPPPPCINGDAEVQCKIFLAEECFKSKFMQFRTTK